MKLVCVVVLALLTVVAASPYGYGVKGGASAAAKADSSAAAAPISGVSVVPLSIPSGGSYSGSFSKSSASSFASSSASSSSGSFTYSGSGSIPGGYSVNGISGNTKCTSGNCPTGNYGPTGVGTGNIGYTGAYSGANAAAGAGAIAFPGSYGNNAGCSGNVCKPVCEGDSCGANSNTVTKNTDKKCASGDCNVPALTSTTSAGHDSNDIYVSTSGSQISSNRDNPSNIPFSGSASACTYGNCSPTASTETKLPYPSPSDTHPSTTVTATKPLPSLVAPKEDKPCTSPNCGSSSYNKENPSSYNVPVYYQNVTPCSSGNCGDSEPHSSTIPAAPSTSIVCERGNCGNSNKPTPGFPSKTTSNSANDYADFVPLAPTGSSVKPVYTQSVPTHAPQVPTGAAPTGTYSKSNNYGPPKPLAPVAPTSESKIPYTGGFGGPAGFLKPNEFTAPSSISSTSYKPDLPTGSHNNPHAPIGPAAPIHLTPCTSGNCGSSPSNYKPAVPTTSYPSPGQSTGGFGGPPGFLKPNEFTAPSSISSTSYKPDLPTGLHNNPPAPIGPAAPIHLTPCTSGNCGSSPPNYKPAVPTTSYPSPGQSTGGFGGPPGFLKPNEFTAPSSISSTSYNPDLPTGLHNNPPAPIGPAAPIHLTPCTSGNCGSSPPNYKPAVPTTSYPTPGQSTSTNYQSGLPSNSQYKPTKPNDKGCIFGNCGIQSSHSTQQDDSGSYKPSGSYSPNGETGSPSPIFCTSGNCGGQPQPNPSTPTISYSPTGCSSGNCGSQPHYSKPQFGQSGSYKPSFQPDKPSNPIGTNEPLCTSGDCGSQPSPPLPHYESSISSNTHVSGPSYKPTASPGSYNPSCPSGNCGVQPSQLAPQYGQNPFYKPLSPTGGYNPSASYNPTGCDSRNCGASPPSPSQFGQGGLYKPTGPAGSYTPTGTPIGSYGQTGCASGACVSPVHTLPQHVSSGSSYNPSIPIGSPGLTTCSSGNCAYPTQQRPTDTYNYGLNNPSGCSSGNCQPISPGSQFNKPTTLTGSYKPSGPYESFNPGCSSGNCAGSFAKPATPVFGAPAGILKPNEFTHVPSTPTGSYKPVLATGQPGITSSVLNPSCSSGKCAVQPGLITGSHAIASAAASANEVLYTGGFGGPPGLLQPYDGGKVPIAPQASGSHTIGKFGSSQGTGVHSSYGKSLNGGFAPGAAENAQGSAITGAAATSYGGSESGGNDYHGAGGCKGGCGDNTGFANAAAGAAAKSYSASSAKAAAGASSGSYASSSASAHSYAGAATKGADMAKDDIDQRDEYDLG